LIKKLVSNIKSLNNELFLARYPKGYVVFTIPVLGMFGIRFPATNVIIIIFLFCIWVVWCLYQSIGKQQQKMIFSSNETWEFEPHINPTGDRLYFGSTRPINDTLKSPGLIQWYSERRNSGWSEPLPLEKPSAATYMMYLTSSANGNLYFTSQEEGAKPENGGIYYAMTEAGGYSDIRKMGNEINTGKMIAHPYIAPDESYMIFDGERPSGFGDSDLYISFKRNGSWTEAYNLGSKINTEQTEMAASVSPARWQVFVFP